MNDKKTEYDRFIALSHSLLDHVATAIAEQKRTPEAIARLEHVRSNLLPLGEFFAQRCGGDDQAYSACYHLIEAVVTISDPEAHSIGIGNARVHASHSVGGDARGEQMTKQVKAWKKHIKEILPKVFKGTVGAIPKKLKRGRKPSLQDVYDDIKENWELEDVSLPSFRTVSGFLSECRDAGLFSC